MPSSHPFNEWLQEGLKKTSERFQEAFLWLKDHMPPSFFQEVSHEHILLITHSLIDFALQGHFTQLNVKHSAYVLCLDTPDADIKVLSHNRMRGIKNYRSYVSNDVAQCFGASAALRITVIGFVSGEIKSESIETVIAKDKQKELFALLETRNKEVRSEQFESLIHQLNPRFLRALSGERLVVALDMFFRAQKRDNCQYELRYNKDWQEKKETPSLQVVFAWRNVPQSHFLYRIAKMVDRHSLKLQRVNAMYIDPSSRQNILIMSIGIHGKTGRAAWEEADVDDFIRELVTLKYFEGLKEIDRTFIDSKLTTGNIGNLLKSMTYFIHQILLHADPHIYSLMQIEEDLCRHPELTEKILKAFELKFHPEQHNIEKYQRLKEDIHKLINDVDTGNVMNDERRKNILTQALYFVDFCLKTNFFRNNKTAHSFRFDPLYLDYAPFDRSKKFPELPFAIFFMKGEHYIGFHIRFKDLSRGGLRTVIPERKEQVLSERNNVFAECYNLAYTQQKKNKDIPEGGAKGVIFVEPKHAILEEKEIYQKELEERALGKEKTEELLKRFIQEHKLEHMYAAQRSYIESFVTLLNCDDDGRLRAKNIIDYWKKPEYVYLGPDENMHNEMIEWIAAYSKYYDYKPKGAFISSKPSAGINHKEFGVTSLGVNVYVEEVLLYMGIDPKKDPFTIKMSGGPDGDVAGNEMANLAKLYPKTAKLLSTIDVSGTIFDPEGLDLQEIYHLFEEQKPIRFYPPKKLNKGGFLLDTKTKREHSTYAQQTLLWKNIDGKLHEEWLSGSEMNHILSQTVHKTQADIFVPGGGRPRTLNESNVSQFLNEEGHPTARAIVEGANLYLTFEARRFLEKLGVLIIKDSSANKGGVTCSSFEVLCSLCLTEEEFLKEKKVLVEQILQIIKAQARDEARLLLKTHKESGVFLTDISDAISTKINGFMYEFLSFFQDKTLPSNPKDPLIQALINYCPPLIRDKYHERILKQIPDIHKKAIISCHIASRLVYQRGLDWTPKVIDVLPLICDDPKITGPSI